LKRSDLCQTDLVSGPQPTLQVPGDPPLIPSPSSVLALYFSYPLHGGPRNGHRAGQQRRLL
jgi:hypothetical protein